MANYLVRSVLQPVLLGLLATAIPISSATAPPVRPAAKPTWEGADRYVEQRIRGWLVKVNKALLVKEHDKIRQEMLELLDDHLYRITRVIPASALAKIRKVPIWIELAHPRHPCMCYHISKQWLREHHMNPEKSGCVEIANVRRFLDWTHNQPWMVLHELAHAYHHQVLGVDHAGIRACYDQARRNKLYDSVLHINGSKVRHYACTNPMEYFAEMTEAYFGTNDFFPFVRAELKNHDPRMYAEIEKVWGVGKR
jgi:hypothetical protein